MALHLALEMPSLNGRTIRYPDNGQLKYLSE
jgi:hypothetical protein